MAKKIKGKDLLTIGYAQGRVIGIALNLMAKHYKKETKAAKLTLLTELLSNPLKYNNHEQLNSLAQAIIEAQMPEENPEIPLKKMAIPYKVYGKEHIEKGALTQMNVAMKLPITLAGALMPDAHQGYGLPIGGVLAVNNAVIPYAVGVDIGCRMCLSIFNMPVSYLKGHHAQFKRDIVKHTRFGMGCEFETPIDDPIFNRNEFEDIDIVKQLKAKAYRQIGTSGGGNHFVEYGIVAITDPNNEFNLSTGTYMGILSHSGSRGLGATIAQKYTQIAMNTCKLPKEAKHLAWLNLDTEAGQAYWAAMNLAGDYAAACHHQIHKRLAKAMGEKPIAVVENHHNFAWKETLSNGQQVIVHRKGATPAGKGVLGIIPGSMTAPGFIVRGKGQHEGINSAAHGAGRKMSRRKAKENFTNRDVRQMLQKHGVTLIGGGLDEAPMAYKDINKVMQYQNNLVEIIGTFEPKIVRMAED